MDSDNVFRVARIYAGKRGITMKTLGTYAAGHGHFFERLAVGRVTIRRTEQVLQWFSDNWPDGLEWPADIPRPRPAGHHDHPREAA